MAPFACPHCFPQKIKSAIFFTAVTFYFFLIIFRKKSYFKNVTTDSCSIFHPLSEYVNLINRAEVNLRPYFWKVDWLGDYHSVHFTMFDECLRQCGHEFDDSVEDRQNFSRDRTQSPTRRLWVQSEKLSVAISLLHKLINLET